ncbi:hypothetical protein [Xanthomonas euvesicatoria]|uniref:hypothetical protein n=1 Tax=Xanthomonas TaxID=338 RepID=UPI002456D347|nr:hypothetical protein [Xanthomonas euvesicatoria]MDH4910057.1 hypothetical protein [Xanthomonas euvesicatoria]
MKARVLAMSTGFFFADVGSVGSNQSATLDISLAATMEAVQDKAPPETNNKHNRKYRK